MANTLKTFIITENDAEGREVSKTVAKRTDVQVWENNEKWRITEDKDFKDLESDLLEFGDLSPILVNSGKYWGQAGDAIGGNTRLKVYEKHQKANIWVEVRDPRSEKDFIRMAAIHNRQYSQWNPDALAELTNKYRGDMDISRLGVQLSHTVSLESLHRSYGPTNPTDQENSANEKDRPKQLDSDAYANSMIKQIVLYFDNEEYQKVIKQLDAIALEEKLESNTDIFLFLLKLYATQKKK